MFFEWKFYVLKQECYTPKNLLYKVQQIYNQK